MFNVPSLGKSACTLLLSAWLVVPLSAQTNLLNNPGFESGLAGWTSFGNVFAEASNPPQFVPRSGGGLISMFGQFSSPFNASGVFQQFSASAGDCFEMDAWSRHWSGDALTGPGPPTGNWVVMKIAFFNTSGTEIGGVEQTILDGTSPTNLWIDNPLLGIAPTGTSFVQALVLFIQPGFDGGASHIDDVEFRTVMTPMSTYVPAIPLPSRIDTNGALQIREVRPDGTLAPWTNFEIRGVDMGWTPLGQSPANGISPFVNPDFVFVLDEMKAVGANLLRFYFIPGGLNSPELTATRLTLDLCYLMGLKVLFGLQPELIGTSAGQTSLLNGIAAYKDHPAVLGFSIGNEWNLTLSGAALAAKAVQVQALATIVKAADPDRVVISSLACGPHNDIFRPTPNGSSAATDIVNATPDVDFYGMNLYRTETFHPFYYLWPEHTTNVPYAIFEFGSDSWDQNFMAVDHGPRTADLQRHFDDSHRVAAGPHGQPAYSGMVAFAAVDEWWKNNASGNSIFVQESTGFPTTVNLAVPSNPLADLTFRADLDGHRSEEHFGLLELPSLARKPEFYGMRGRFRNTSLPFSDTSIEVVSSGYVGNAFGLDNGYWGLRYRGNTVFFEQGGGEARGLNIVVFDPSSGGVDEIRNFDTYGALEIPQNTILADATTYVNNLPVGALVGMAVADTFTHFSNNSAAYIALTSAIQSRMGATQLTSNFPFRAGWALIGYVDAPTPLSEVGPQLMTELTATASINLDLDRDGTIDLVDNDIDGDGKTNAWELARGTDPVRPNGQLLRTTFVLNPFTRILTLGIHPGDASGTLLDLDLASFRFEALTPIPMDLNAFLLTPIFVSSLTAEGGFTLSTIGPVPSLPGLRFGFRFMDVSGKLYAESLNLD